MQKRNSHEAFLSELLKLRLIVGYLGEQPRYSWWSTVLFEPASRMFLTPVFPKTSLLAQYTGVVEAARKLHDEHLSTGSFHLFRQPEIIEQDLYMLMKNQGVDVELSQALKSKEEALQALQSMTTQSSNVSEGPLRIGRMKDGDSMESLKLVARAYLGAFNKNIRSYPYWAE